MTRTALFILVVSACGCYRGGPDCVATNAEELRAAATDETCNGIRIADTDLQDLAGLEELDHPVAVSVERNSKLADVSAIRSASGPVTFTNNNALVRAELGEVGELRVDDENEAGSTHALRELAYRLPPSDGELAVLDLHQDGAGGASLETVSISCDAECRPLALRVRARHGFSIDVVLESALLDELAVTSAVFSLSALQSLGVPKRVVTLSIAPRDIADSYLSWLRSEGFQGAFTACVFDGSEPSNDDCDELLEVPADATN